MGKSSSLATFLVTLSVPLYLISDDLFNPIFLLSPLTAYITLRSQDEQEDHDEQDRLAWSDPAACVGLKERWQRVNSFWPSMRSLRKSWNWIVLGSGAVAVAIELQRR